MSPGSPVFRAESLEHAADLLARHGGDAAILSGGQSLIPMMSAGLAAPSALIDINHVPGGDVLDLNADHVSIGPCVRHRALEFAPTEIHSVVPTLQPAARQIAHAAVRQRGTMLGSLAHADPAAEWPAVALATEAKLTLLSSRGAREVEASDFFIGPMTTMRETDEVITAVRVPRAAPRTFASVRELTYRNGDYAVVGVIAQVSFDNGVVSDCRIVLFGVDSTPVRVPEAERLIIAGGLDALEDAGGAALEAANPDGDATASREYRLAMVPVFARRATESAIKTGLLALKEVTE